MCLRSYLSSSQSPVNLRMQVGNCRYRAYMVLHALEPSMSSPPVPCPPHVISCPLSSLHHLLYPPLILSDPWACLLEKGKHSRSQSLCSIVLSAPNVLCPEVRVVHTLTPFTSAVCPLCGRSCPPGSTVLRQCLACGRHFGRRCWKHE